MQRRDIILGGSALAASRLWAGTTPATAAPSAATAAPQGASSRRNLMQTYARMRGAPNGGLALWWYTGTVWGKQPDQMAQPMFAVQGLTFNRIVQSPDGSITQRLTGRGWYADVKTGAALENFINPITGERLTPPHIKSLQTQIIAADGTMPPRDDAALDTFEGKIGDLTFSNDTVWLTENFTAKYKPDATRGGAVTTTSSLSTFTAQIKDVETTIAGFVPAYLNYQSLGSWPAWMKMGEIPGVLSWQTRGQKVRGPEAAPQELRGWIEERYPGFLANPGI